MPILSQSPCSRPVDSPVDLHDVSSCPVDPACAVCGTSADLHVQSSTTDVGAFCVTVCSSCPTPPLRALDLLARCTQHAEHLGIDGAAMVALCDSAPPWQPPAVPESAQLEEYDKRVAAEDRARAAELLLLRVALHLELTTLAPDAAETARLLQVWMGGAR